jgi:hypothetical protein
MNCTKYYSAVVIQNVEQTNMQGRNVVVFLMSLCAVI